MTYDETEIVADAGVRLRIIADGMLAMADLAMDDHVVKAFQGMARHVDEVRVRLCALPIEAEYTMQACPTCSGMGHVRAIVETKAFGPFEVCPTCNGTGNVRVESEGEAA